MPVPDCPGTSGLTLITIGSFFFYFSLGFPWERDVHSSRGILLAAPSA